MKKQIKILITFAILTLYLLSLVSIVNALVVKSVTTNPVEIAPGETSTIQVELENEGNDDITDVSVVLDFENVPFAPYLSTSEDSIDVIDSDDSENARFRIIALNNAGSGIYKIPMTITYNEDDVTKTKNSLISLTVNSKPILGVEAEDALFIKGAKSDLKIRVTNKGLSDIRFLEVVLGSSGYVDLLSQGGVYIGDIDSDDFDTADYQVFFKKNSPDKITIPVTLNYRDATNNEKSETFNLQLNVYSTEKAIELGLMQKSYTSYYVAGAVVIVILFFIYRSWRKRKRLKKANSNGDF